MYTSGLPQAEKTKRQEALGARAAGIDRWPPYSVVIYDRSSAEATVIWEMMAVSIR